MAEVLLLPCTDLHPLLQQSKNTKDANSDEMDDKFCVYGLHSVYISYATQHNMYKILALAYTTLQFQENGLFL